MAPARPKTSERVIPLHSNNDIFDMLGHRRAPEIPGKVFFLLAERKVNPDLVITLNKISITTNETISIQWYCVGPFHTIWITLTC